MESISTEVCTEPAKRDTRGRRIAQAQERRRLLEAYAHSGMTQRAFCRREGINYHTFTTWLGRSRRGLEAAGAPASASFTELVLGTGRPAAALEVQLLDGTLVRGADAAAVARLAGLLRR